MPRDFLKTFSVGFLARRRRDGTVERVGATPSADEVAGPRPLSATLRSLLARHPEAVCTDIRPPGVLAHGIVRGSWLVDPEDAVAQAHGWLHSPWFLVLGEDQVDTDRTVGGLRASGCRAAGFPGLALWKEAGAAVREPAWKSPLPVRHHVRVAPGATPGTDPEGSWRPEGTIQDVHWAETHFLYDVLVRLNGRMQRVDGLEEEQLESLGPRGAAGMGETL